MTNCVVFHHDDTPGLLAHLAETGIAAGTIGAGTVRFMTHLDIDDDDVAAVVAAIRIA